MRSPDVGISVWARIGWKARAPLQLAGRRGTHLQEQEEGRTLKRDASNLASVLRELQRDDPETLERIREVLAAVVPGTIDVDTVRRGNKVTLEFGQQVGADRLLRFDAFSMSDGTLRVLGLLVAVAQLPRLRLALIEEPEATIHPGAVPALIEGLRELAGDGQLVFSTQSTDLLDQLEMEELRVVSLHQGATLISEIGEHSREAIRRELFSPGELWRANALDGTPVEEPVQLDLFAA